MAEVYSSAENAYYETFISFCDKETGFMSWDALWECVMCHPSMRSMKPKTVREHVLEVCRGEAVSLQGFVDVIESVRARYELGEVDGVRQRLEYHALNEVFNGKQSKERISRSELRKYLENLHAKSDAPKARITPKDMDQYLEEADLERNKYISRDEFHYLLTEVLYDERPDLCVSDYVLGARSTGGVIVNTFEQLKERTRSSFSAVSTVLGKAATPTTAASPKARPHDSMLRHDDMGSISGHSAGSQALLPAPSSPLSLRSHSFRESTSPSGKLKKGWGRVKDRLAGGSFSPASLSPSGSFFKAAADGGRAGSFMSLASGALCEDCERRDVVIKALRAELAEARARGDAAVAELQAAEEAVSGGVARLREQNAQVEAAGKERDAAKETAKAAKAAAEKCRKETAARGEKLAKVEAEVGGLKERVAAEKERADELKRLRKEQMDVDRKKTVEAAKARQKSDAVVAGLRDALETLEVEARLREAEAQAAKEEAERSRHHHHHHPIGRRASWQSSSSSSSSTSAATSTPDRVAPLFLPQTGVVSSGAAAGSAATAAGRRSETLFNEGPIVYNFNNRVFPNNVSLDVHLSAPVSKEHITLRDCTGARSVCLELSAFDLVVPCTTLTHRLSPHTWYSVLVCLDWEGMLFNVYVNGTLVFDDVDFRDPTEEGLSVFDVYPRTTTAVTYANICFAADTTAEAVQGGGDGGCTRRQ